jgi:hypothetical protein
MVSENFEEAKDESGVLCLVRDSRLEILDEVDRGGSEDGLVMLYTILRCIVCYVEI